MAWELFRRDGAGAIEMIGVDGDLLDVAPIDTLPLAVEITIDAPSTLPEFIGPAEVALEAITDELGGCLAGTSRTATQLWTLVHLPNDEHASRFMQIPLPARASVSVAPANDPDWTIFDRVRPIGIEQQSMSDLGVMAALHRAGDTGGSRRIEHRITDLDDERSRACATAIGSVGFEVAPHRDGGLAVVHDADPSDLTSDSWTVRLVAERHGGIYAGWTCERIAPDRVTSKKKRWFGRR